MFTSLLPRGRRSTVLSRFNPCKSSTSLDISYDGVVSTPGIVHSPRADALLRNVDLPLRATLYPLGFRLDLLTNSKDVADAAAEAWGSFRAEFDGPPMELRVVVQEQGDLATEPVFRAQRHLF